MMTGWTAKGNRGEYSLGRAPVGRSDTGVHDDKVDGKEIAWERAQRGSLESSVGRSDTGVTGCGQKGNRGK